MAGFDYLIDASAGLYGDEAQEMALKEIERSERFWQSVQPKGGNEGDATKGGVRTTDEIISMYRHRINDMGIKSKTEVMLMTDEYQQAAFDLCFRLIFDEFPGRAGSIIDIGCGYGCLLGFLRNRGWSGTYIGIDLVPEMIEQARHHFADDAKAKFVCGDFLVESLGPADVCVATSIFGVPSGDDMMEKILARALGCARNGVVATFNCEDRRTLPPVVKSYRSKDVVPMALRLCRDVSNVVFRHQCIELQKGQYHALAGISLRKDSCQLNARPSSPIPRGSPYRYSPINWFLDA